MVNLRPRLRASAISSSASESSIAIGFSRKTCLPASRQSRAIGKCVVSEPLRPDLGDVQRCDQRMRRADLGADPAAPAGADDRNFDRFHGFFGSWLNQMLVGVACSTQGARNLTIYAGFQRAARFCANDANPSAASADWRFAA